MKKTRIRCPTTISGRGDNRVDRGICRIGKKNSEIVLLEALHWMWMGTAMGRWVLHWDRSLDERPCCKMAG
jgi:hypothetical protein